MKAGHVSRSLKAGQYKPNVSCVALRNLTTNMTVPWSFSQSTSMTSSSTTASSPSPNSTPPNFTDWLHISPAPQLTVSPMMMMMMPPFQDLSSSARINHGFQDPDHFLHNMYGVSDFLRFGGTPAGVVPMCLSPPTVFNSHHDSTITTLVDPPSPESLTLFPSTQLALGHQSQSPQFLPPSTSLFTSSASKFIEDLQTSISPFGNHFGHSAAPFATLPLGDISPVVRAEESQSGPHKLSSGPKRFRNRKRRNQASSFVQKLRSVPSPAITPFSSAPDLLEEPIDQRLLSPCKLVPSTSNNISVDNRAVLDIPASPPDVSGAFTVAPLPLVKAIAEREIVSPLTPLTPLSSSPGLSSPLPPPPHPPLKIVLKLKRRLMDELPTTPPRRSKRSRRTTLVDVLSPITDQRSSSPLTELSPEFNPTNPQNHRRPVFTDRKLPPTIEILATYPLFYRRFPASRHFQLDDSE